MTKIKAVSVCAYAVYLDLAEQYVGLLFPVKPRMRQRLIWRQHRAHMLQAFEHSLLWLRVEGRGGDRSSV